MELARLNYQLKLSNVHYRYEHHGRGSGKIKEKCFVGDGVAERSVRGVAFYSM